MKQKQYSPDSLWLFEKLEERILLSADLPLVQAQNSDPTAVEPPPAEEISNVRAEDAEQSNALEEYEAVLDDKLVDISPDLSEEATAPAETAEADPQEEDFPGNNQLEITGPALLPDPDNTVIANLTDIHLEPDQIFTPPDEGVIIDDNEILTGSGEIDGLVINEGEVSPGNSPGIISTDIFNQTASGTLTIEIGGSSPGPGTTVVDDGYDQLNVSGTATLDGTLAISLINDFIPSSGQVYDILTYSNRVGEFSNYEGLYLGDGLFLKPVYTDSGLSLHVAELYSGLKLDLPNQTILDEVMDFIVHTDTPESLAVSGSIEIGGIHINGNLNLKHTAGGLGVGLSNVSVSENLGPLNLSITNGSGALITGGTGTAIQLSGQATISGIPGLTITGNISYRSNTSGGPVNETIGTVDLLFDGNSPVTIAGSLALDVKNFVNVSGDMYLVQDKSGATTKLLIDGTNLTASIGSGASLSGGSLAMIVDTGAEGSGGYAVSGSGNISVSSGGLDVDVGGSVALEANTLMRTVDESFNISGTARTITFTTADQRHSLTPSSLDVQLNSFLVESLHDLGGEIIGLRDQLFASYSNGAIVSPGILAANILGSTTTLEGLLGLNNLLSIGEYIQAFVQPITGEDLGDNPPPEPNYTFDPGDTDYPSFQDLLSYLDTHWLPNLTGFSPGALSLALSDAGFKLAFQDTSTTTKTISLGLGEAIEEFGLTLDSPLTVDLTVSNKVDFGVVIDWTGGGVSFQLGNMDFSAQAVVDNWVTSATFGPLDVSIGSASGEKAVIALNLGGRLSLNSSDAFAVTLFDDSITFDMPVYTSFAGTDLSAVAGLPRLLMEGAAFSGMDFTYETVNFDAIGSFTNVSVVDLLLMFPSFVEMLDEVRQDDTFVAEIPFVENSLDQLFYFSQGFQTSIYDPIFSLTEEVDVFDENGVKTGTTIQPREIISIQDFVQAVNDSGVLPQGVEVSYDVATSKFFVPFAFNYDLADEQTDLAFMLEMGELSLATGATGLLKTTVSGGLKMFFDLDGETISGDDGTVVAASTTFSSGSSEFTSSMVGWELDIEGDTYTIQSVTDSHTLQLDREIAINIAAAAFVIREGYRMGIEDVEVEATLDLDVNDLVVAGQIGFLGLTLGGTGSGSGLHVDMAGSASFTKADGDTRLTFADINDGSYLDALTLSVSGSASAILKNLTVSPGFGDDIAMPGSPEVAIYIQDAIDIGDTVVANHDPLGAAFNLGEFIAAGNSTMNDIVVVVPDLGEAFNFKDLSFIDFVHAFRKGVEFIEDSFNDNDFYTTNIPVLNFSLSDSLTFFDDLAARLEELDANSAATIQGVEELFEDILGINDNNENLPVDQLFAITIEDGALKIHMEYEKIFSDLVTFNLDLQSLIGLSHTDFPGLEGIKLLSDNLGVGASANILFESKFGFQLEAGIDLSNLIDPEIFLYDYDENDLSGTAAVLGFRVAGSDLELGFNIGPLSLGVAGGSVVIDGDGDKTTSSDFATLTIRLDQLDASALGDAVDQAVKDNLPADDGRFHFSLEEIRYNISPVIVGDMSIDLPLFINVEGFEFSLDGFDISLPTGISIGDLLSGINLPELPDIPLVTITAPDILGWLEANVGAFNLMMFLNSPSLIIDGIDFSLGSLGDLFLDGFSVDLPFIGDILYDFGSFITDIRLDLLADLRLDLSVNGGVVEIMRQVYWNVFGENGLNVLQDSTGDSTIDINDVLVGWYDIDGVLIEEWDKDGEMASGSNAIQFDMLLGATLFGTGVDIPLDIDLPGFEFAIEGGFGMAMDWYFEFGTGISGTDGFYLVTNDTDEPEFAVNIDLFLDGNPDDTSFITPFAGVGSLAFFKATLTDKDKNPATPEFDPSGLFGTFFIDIVGDERGRLTMLEMGAKPLSDVFVTDFIMDGDIHLDVVLELDGVTGMPKLVGDLIIDWDYSLTNGLSSPSISIENFGVDVSSLVDDFLLPIIDNIAGILAPFEPVVDALYTTIPGLDEIGIDNVMDLIDTVMKLQRRPAINWAFVDAVNTMIKMPDEVREWAEGGIIYLGDIKGFGTTQVESVTLPDIDLGGLEAKFADLAERSAAGAANSSARSGFKMIEYVTDISNWVNIFTGGDATLFTYEMPLLKAIASINVPIFQVGIDVANFSVKAKGKLTAMADLAFGYDTYGIRKALETGNPLYAFDGFYTSDVSLPTFKNGSIVPGTGGVDKPEFSFSLDLALNASVSAAVVEGGLQGGIEFIADFDLQDISIAELVKDSAGNVLQANLVSDGKIRFSEIVTMYEYEDGGFANLFNFDGTTEIYAKAYVDVTVGFITETVFEADLFRMELFSFSHSAPNVEPVLAHNQNGTLYLNCGADAGDRLYLDTDDGAEHFYITGNADTVYVEYGDWYQSFDNVTQVVAYLGEGDDLLDASLLQGVKVLATGGAGNDTIILGKAGGRAFGEEGNDILTGVSGVNELVGGLGDDVLTGGSGNDTLTGEAGNDQLFGGGGDDILDGGTGNDKLEGGDGNDTYLFAENYGMDRFRDQVGETSLDFSAMSTTLDVTMSRDGVSVAAINGDELRTGRAKVTALTLGTGNDQLRVRSFANGAVTVTDSGGNDDYRVRLDRAASTLPSGRLNIVDNSGAFDELIVMQTSFGSSAAPTPVYLNSQEVANGRETISYNTGIERLTLTGKDSLYTAESIKAFGGKVSFANSDNSGTSDLGSTSFRAIASTITMGSAIEAGNITMSSFNSLNISHQVNAVNNGYIDLAVYGDSSDITLNADLRVSSADNSDGLGSGWLRLISPDGSIINGNSSEILAAGSTLQLRAEGALSTTAAPLLTTVANLTAITRSTGSSDLVIIETDNLTIQTQQTLTATENPGFVVNPANGADSWESKVDWDNDSSSDWLTVIGPGRTDYGIEVGNGDLDITLLAEDALLTLQSGDIHLLADGADITLTTDDLDFASGEERVTASGNLTIQANQTVWDYLLGSAAEGSGGPEMDRSFHSSSMAMGMRDFAALSNGFASIAIGRRNAGNTMLLGDLYHASEVKMTGQPRDDNATLRDHTIFLSDDLQVKGDVRADDNTLELHSQTMSINSHTVHNILGAPDSGVSAETLIIQVDEQLHVGGWIVADTLVDIDVLASTGVKRTTAEKFLTPANGIISINMDVGSRIESLEDASLVDIDTSHGMQVGSVIEAHGAGSHIDIDSGSYFLLNEAAELAARGVAGLVDIEAATLMAINAGSAVSAGIRYDQVNGAPVAVMTGAGADIRLVAANEMLLSGAITTADGLIIDSGNSTVDDADYGEPGHASYDAAYRIYNKTAYFENIAEVSTEHYLVSHDRGYGMLVTGTITSLGTNQELSISSAEDVIVRGNIYATGSGSTITLASDQWVFGEGFLTADSGITITGEGSDDHGTSVYVHATSTISTTAAGANITVTGSEDVDLYGVLVAGGAVGENGVIWSGAGSDLSVTAGGQLLIDTGLLAAGNVAVNGGVPGAGDNNLGMLITAAGGVSARGYMGVGGNITSVSSGNMQMMGTLVAGGSLLQTFDGDGNLLTQTIDYSGTEGTVNIVNSGQTWIGGNTVDINNDPVIAGGYIYSAGNISFGGGSSSDGVGVKISGASEVVVKKADGTVHVDATDDAVIEGLLVAGGEITQVRDAEGKLQGRSVVHFDGASRILIEADEQIIVGVGLQAGKSIDLVGGVDPSGTGIILYGSAMLETWQENSTINLNAPGRIDILAPGHTNELLAESWPITSGGNLSQDVTLDIIIDKLSHEIAASVTIAAAATAANNSVNDLLSDIQQALELGAWEITRSDVAEFTVGASYTDFVANADLKMKLREGRLNFTGSNSFKIQSTSTHSDQLGLDLTGGDLTSGLYYAIDARSIGSVVNIGAENGPNGKLYIAGKVIADSAINLHSGISPDHIDIELDVTGVLETVNGTIAFDAGENGVVRGNVIAGGTGADIVLNSDTSLTIEGKLAAYNDVILLGGIGEVTDQLSLKIASTASVISTGGGGSLTLSGANDVIIDGLVGTGSTDLAGVIISSTYGGVTVTKESGWISADAPLSITGYDIDIGGVIESSLANGNGTEVSLTAARNLSVHGDLSVEGDLLLHGENSVLIYDATIAVGAADALLTVTSGGDITTSAIAVASDHATLPDGQLYQQGATIQGTGSVTFTAADSLTIGSAVLVGTRLDNSSIELVGSTITVIGSVAAGAAVHSGTSVWQGKNATIDISATERLNIGGNAIDADGFSSAQGGNITSTGNLAINVTGGSNPVSLSQNGLSTISADSTADGSLAADGSASHVSITTDHALQLHGLVTAPEASGTVTLVSGDQAFFNGIIIAGQTISISAGDDTSGVSVLSQQHVYVTDPSSGFFVDENGRLMDGFGYLVNSSGVYVDAAGTVLAGGVDPVAGGEPIRITGATFTTDPGGTLSITGVNDVNLGGQLGKPVTEGNSVTVNLDEITVSSSLGDINISGLVNSSQSVSLAAENISVLQGGVVKTRGAAGTVRLDASENIYVGWDSSSGDSIVSAAELVHLSGKNIRLDGLVEAEGETDSLILVNSAVSLVIGGTLATSGNAELRGGVDLSWSESELTSTVVLSDLGNALISIIGEGSVLADGDINVITGGDFSIEAQAMLQDDQLALLTPIITNEAVTIQVVTGYQHVVTGTISIPKVSWVTTTVTEQIGTQQVKVGISYKTMDVTLTQTAYYNGSTIREWFVEGVDYFNNQVNWALTGSTAPTGSYVPYNDLDDKQQLAVQKHLGYKPLYDFTGSNYKLNQVISGNPTSQGWTPDWLGNSFEIVNIQVAGWEDKYIKLRSGAAADVLRVVSQGAGTVGSEIVGRYQDEATVLYEQVASAHTSSQYDLYEPYRTNGTTGDQVYWQTAYISDTDGEVARWQVKYVNTTGDRIYEVYDGRTGSSAVSHAYDPEWYGEGSSITYDTGISQNTLRTSAPNGYFDTTLSVTSGVLVGTSLEIVGQDDGYNYDDRDYGRGPNTDWDNAIASAATIGAELLVVGSTGELDYITHLLDNGLAPPFAFNGFAYLIGAYDDADGVSHWSPNNPSGYPSRYLWIDGTRLENYGEWHNNEPNTYSKDGEYVYLAKGGDYYNYWAYAARKEGYSAGADGFIWEQAPSKGTPENVTETFYDYNSEWESVWNTISDNRKTLQYQFTSNTTDIFEDQPVYATYDVTSKVVSSQSITLWSNEPVTSDQIINRTTRIYDTTNVDYGAFENDALQAAGNISIVTADDASLSGLVSGTGVNSLVTVTSGGDIVVNGEVPDLADPGTVAATSKITSGSTLTLTAGGTLTIGEAGELTSSVEIDLHSMGHASIGGELNAGTTVTITTPGNIGLEGKITAADFILVTAGEGDGIGSILGSTAATDLIVTGGNGSIELVAGSVGGNITLANGSLTAGSIDLDAASGSINHSGGLITGSTLTATSHSGFVASTNIDTIAVANSGSGGIVLRNNDILNILSLETASGQISVTNFGAVIATTIRNSGTSNDDDIDILVYGGGLSYETITVGSGGLGDISLQLQGALTSTGGNTLIQSDELLIDLPGPINIVTDVNSLSLRSYEGGDVTVIDQGASGLVVKNVEIAEGSLSVTAAGNLGIDNVALLSVNEDVTLHSAGLVYGIVNGNTDIIADQLTITAATGITPLRVQVNELLSLVTTTGDIHITNSSFTSSYDVIEDLTITEANAASGSVTVINDATIVAHEVRAVGASSALHLQSTAGNLIVRDPQGGNGLYAGSQMELDAKLKLDLEVQVDAADSLVLRTGERITLATTATYGADSILVESEDTVEMHGNLVMGGESFTIISGRNIILDGTIRSSVGGAVGSLTLTSSGNSPQETFDVDPLFGYAVYRDTTGKVVLEDANTRLYRTEINNKYVQSGLYVVNSTTSVVRNFLSSTLNGSGVLTEINGAAVDESRITILGRGAEDVTSTTNRATLTRQSQFSTTSDIEVNLGSQAFTSINITAGGSEGTITLSASQNLDLTHSLLQATKDITLTNSSGSFFTNGTDTVVRGTDLVVSAVSGIDLLTDVDTIRASLSGAGSVQIVDNSSVILENIFVQNGDILVAAQGTISAVDLRIATDANGNVVSLSNGSGNITAGYINAGRNYGDITIFAQAGIWEIQPDDPDVDIVARNFKAIGSNNTTDLEINAATQQIGRPDNLVLDYYGDLVLSGNYVGTINVIVHGDLYLDGITSGLSSTYFAYDDVIVQGIARAANGQMRVTADTINFSTSGVMSGTTLDLDATVGGFTMEGSSTLTSSAGTIDIDAKGDIDLTRVTSAGLLDVRTTGGVLNSTIQTSSAGNTYFSATGPMDLDRMIVGGTLTINSGEVVALTDDVTVTSSATINGVGLSHDSWVDLTAHTLTLAAGSGSFTMAGTSTLTSTSGDVSVSANGAMVLDKITSNDDIYISSNNAVTLNDTLFAVNIVDIAGRGIVFTNAAGVDSRSMDLDAMTGTFTMATTASLASDNATVLASSGDMTLATIAAGSLTGTTAGDMLLNGNLTISGGLSLDGESITVGGSTAVQGGNLDLDATAGTFTMNSGSTMTSTAGATVIDASGDILLTTLTSAGDLSVSSTGGSLTTSVLTDVAGATTFIAAGPVSLNTLETDGELVITGTDTVSLNGDVSSLGSMAITGTEIRFAAGVSISGTSVDLDASAGEIAMGSGSTLASTSGSTDIDAAGDITLTALSSAALLSVASTGGAVSTSVSTESAGASTFTAAGPISLNILEAGGNLLVDGSDTVALNGDVSSIGSVVITGTEIRFAAGVSISGTSVDLDASAGEIAMGSGSTLASTSGSTDIGATGDITLTALSSAALLSVASTGGAVSTSVSSESAGASTFTAAGPISLNILEAGGNLLVDGGGLISHTGDVTVAGDIDITGSSIDIAAGITIKGSTIDLFAHPGTIFMHSLATLESTGPINVEATGGIILSTIDVSAGFVDIVSTSSLTFTENVFASETISVTSRSMTFADGITVAGTTLTLDATAGDLIMENGSTLTARTGATELTSSGNMFLSTVDSSGDITLNAGGRIEDSSTDETPNLITAGSLFVTAGGGVGLAAEDLDLDIGTAIRSTTISGGTNLTNNGLFRVTDRIEAGSGDVKLTSLSEDMIISGSVTAAGGNVGITGNGNVLISQIRGSGNVLVEAVNGDIRDISVDETANITSGGIIGLSSAGNIGQAGPADIDIDGRVAARSSNGSVFLEGLRGITVSSFGISAGGDSINLATGGDVIIEAPVISSGGSVNISGNRFSVNSTVGGSNISLAGSSEIDISSRGFIAGGSSVTVTGASIEQAGAIISQGPISVTATGGAITLSGLTIGGFGLVSYDAAGNLSINSIIGGGTVSLIAGGGGISDYSNNNWINVSANTVVMKSGGPIGTVGGDGFDIDTSYISAISQSGGIHLRFTEGPQVISPGIWALNGGDIYLTRDSGSIRHGGFAENSRGILSGNMIGTVGGGSINLITRAVTTNLIVEGGTEDSGAGGNTHNLIEMLQQRGIENSRFASGSSRPENIDSSSRDILDDLFPGAESLLSELFTDPGPVRVLDDLFVTDGEDVPVNSVEIPPELAPLPDPATASLQDLIHFYSNQNQNNPLENNSPSNWHDTRNWPVRFSNSGLVGSIIQEQAQLEKN